jgi:NADPH:quinone reductase-like Zn-dependent oxidoreductase
MRATVMYGAGDVRIETVPDARLIEPTDALVAVTHACICGSDLWPYNQMEQRDTGQRMGHEFIGVVEAVGADVNTVKVATSWLRRSRGPTAPASSVRRGYTRPASTEASGPGTASTDDKARRCACPWLTGRSSFCRSVQTTS